MASHMEEGFRALADPTRRAILQLLKKGDMTAGEIAGHFTISKPSLSHHLTVLKQADLVMDTREGKHRRYSLNTTVFQDIAGWMLEMFSDS